MATAKEPGSVGDSWSDRREKGGGGGKANGGGGGGTGEDVIGTADGMRNGVGRMRTTVACGRSCSAKYAATTTNAQIAADEWRILALHALVGVLG